MTNSRYAIHSKAGRNYFKSISYGFKSSIGTQLVIHKPKASLNSIMVENRIKLSKSAGYVAEVCFGVESIKELHTAFSI